MEKYKDLQIDKVNRTDKYYIIDWTMDWQFGQVVIDNTTHVVVDDDACSVAFLEKLIPMALSWYEQHKK